MLQPIVVRPLAGGTYELVAGERRLRAAKSAGLDTIPALVREAEDSERLELALAEATCAREDLNPVEEARACALLVDDLGISKAEAGRRVGRSRAAISNLIRLLALPDEALDLVEAGTLSEAHGRALLLCKDHGQRKRLALAARDEGWSVADRGTRPRPRGSGQAPAAQGEVTPIPTSPRRSPRPKTPSPRRSDAPSSYAPGARAAAPRSTSKSPPRRSRSRSRCSPSGR